MYLGKKISVVVPAYNEEVLIIETLSGIPEFVDRIYVVNDGSTDSTHQIIDSFVASPQHFRITPIHHLENRGVGAAIVSGYKAALADEMDVAVVMAGDNQMDPGYLQPLLDPIVENKADYTKGDRLTQSVHTQGMTLWRRLGNGTLKWLTRVASGNYHLIDPQDGYTAISRQSLMRLDLDSIFPFYGYCNDILVKLSFLNARILEIPRPYSYTDKAKSKIKYHTYIPRVSLLLFRDFQWRLKNQAKRRINHIRKGN